MPLAHNHSGSDAHAAGIPPHQNHRELASQVKPISPKPITCYDPSPVNIGTKIVYST